MQNPRWCCRNKHLKVPAVREDIGNKYFKSTSLHWVYKHVKVPRVCEDVGMRVQVMHAPVLWVVFEEEDIVRTDFLACNYNVRKILKARFKPNFADWSNNAKILSQTLHRAI